MDKYRPCPSIIAMFTSDSQHPPRSIHAVYLGVDQTDVVEKIKGYTYKSSYISITKYPRLPNLVQNLSTEKVLLPNDPICRF